MSGTDLAYAAIACYAMSGTDLAYAATVCYAMPDTDLAYAATACISCLYRMVLLHAMRCPVLT
eukprot:2708993-Rhodomonas_salina.1